MACALGVGTARPGDAAVMIGTSAVLCALMVASLFGVGVALSEGATLAAPIGAARLAMAAVAGAEPLAILGRKPRVQRRIDPDPTLARRLKARMPAWRKLD